MASLDRDLRKQLERTVRQARRFAEEGAEKAIEQLGVGESEAPRHLRPEQKALRNRLRAHGRQLGDERNEKTKTQATEHLIAECAYEHWHRMLFARFLAENDLLIEPESGMAISLQEAHELARDKSTDWLALASDYAERMLPQIFRKGDPALEIVLPPEARSELEDLLKELPRDVFVADDSLGWVYQFWQADKKDEVNESGNKIGADALSAVTQLFTEDYMVLFLLHNTMGAWWAGKVLAKNPKLVATADSEDELRAACKVGDVDWSYLRFVRDKAEDGTDGGWRPAAGIFNGWPKAAKDITVLDPCMGSGHFLIFALPILVAIRMAEEGISHSAAVQAVVKENLFGLELDPRCTQIGAFNLALAAWRRVGYCVLPAMNLACSGLAPNAKKEDWLALAGDDVRQRSGMEGLYRLFESAPVLGSLINPRASDGDLLVAAFHELRPLLETALANESKDDTEQEMAVTAHGLAKAAEILAGQFTLLATNVPFLRRGSQCAELQDYIEDFFVAGKADLATAFLLRCIDFLDAHGTYACVSQQHFLYLGSYEDFRVNMLTKERVNFVLRLGSGAFETISGENVSVALSCVTRAKPVGSDCISYFDASLAKAPSEKADLIRLGGLTQLGQLTQVENPDSRIGFSLDGEGPLLQTRAGAFVGLQNGDTPRFIASFWELPRIETPWEAFQLTTDETVPFGGRDGILRWEQGCGVLAFATYARVQGAEAWGRKGVAVRNTVPLPVTLYSGELFDQSSTAIIPENAEDLTALWAFCSSDEFLPAVQLVDGKRNKTNQTYLKIPFDVERWQKIAAVQYPKGLPPPFSSSPTQWLFDGNPAGSDQPLQVAVARLLGYRWPRQTGSSFADCPKLAADGLERLADDDGIVPMSSVRGEAPAADRLRELLALSYGQDWNASMQEQLLAQAGSAEGTLHDWLRNGFFEQHCALFNNRPFIWHVWDGLRDGFHVLVNYHRLAAPSGEGRRTLERLVYAYLGDWITRQRADQATEVDGADSRVAHAEHLKAELIKILEGEPPYDIFVRWKPLHEQAMGWEPDINDGVRLNIRPFMTARTLNARGTTSCILRTTPKSIKWDKDRGKEPNRDKADYPWFWGWDGETDDFSGGREFDGNRWNDLHYSKAVKQAARERHKSKAKGKK